jgi:outer membrane protein TolC
MKKFHLDDLHLTNLNDAPLTAARAIRRIAFTFPMLWPLAILLFDPTISRAIGAIGNCSARSWATIGRMRFRIGRLRHANGVSSTLAPSWRFTAMGAGLIAMIASGLVATTPLVHAQGPTVGANGNSGTQTAPVVSQGSSAGVDVSVPPQVPTRFVTNPILSLPNIFVRQWIPGREDLPVDHFNLMEDNLEGQRLTLKETIYLALKNNPGLESVALDPVAATASVSGSNAVFDPQLSSQIDTEKETSPVSSPFQNPGSITDVSKFYDWNFGMSKVLSLSNATFGVTFNNDRELTNSAFSPVNPVYTPTLVMSLSQPLLQNFGWQFATINVRLAESAQRSSQWNYASSVNDFVQRIGNDYWGVVQAEENLQVTQSALQFNQDLVRVNGNNVKLGMMAAVNLSEALSAAATARANLRAARAALEIARTTLRQDVALNNTAALVGAEIEPLQRPDTRIESPESEEVAFERMLEESPSLAGLRESIRSALIQVKYAENQTLPQLNLGTQFGISSEAGNSKCTSSISVPTYANCFSPKGPTVPPGADNAAELPFAGDYSSALNSMFDFKFYDYAAVLSFSIPLDNAAAKAALEQAHISYEQNRLQYRQALYQAVLQVKSALANLRAYDDQVEAAQEATYYAVKSLRDVQAQFRVGMATTNQLLQYQSNMVTAQGSEVQTDVGLENARLALWHAEGSLLEHFNIDFQLQNPHQSPWYSRF